MGISSAGFSLWVLVLARTNPHRLEACATEMLPEEVASRALVV